jgi:glutamine phosphoribosylpyrophosphate amidotransferase
VLSKPKIPAGGRLSRATDPGFILIHPFGLDAYLDPQARRTAAAEFRTGQVIISETPALDVFGNYYVAQLANGELGLYDRSKGLQATVKLPGH